MSEEQVQQLLEDLKTLAAPDCLFCAHNTPEGIDRCEDCGYDCDRCPEPCPCKDCGRHNGHAGWKWRGAECPPHVNRRYIMEEAKKEHQDLFKSAIARLKTAGVDTTCYKDVVIALETENRHYLDLIEHLKEAGEAKREKAHKSGIERGKNLGQCAMAAKILEYFMECCSSSDDHLIHIGIEDLTGICIAAWMELQGMEPD